MTNIVTHTGMPIRFAIIDTNTLACMGLRQLLEQLLPMADIETYASLQELQKEADQRFLHYFVSSKIYFENAPFFREHPKKAIVLTNGMMNINGVFTLNVCQDAKSLVRDIVALQDKGHGRAMAMAKENTTKESLFSARETEVARLLCKGYINKEIADELNVSTTTVITHRKNIMEKLHAHSLANIILYCVVNGIVSVEEL